MFEDILLESRSKNSTAATAASFSVQVVLLAVLVCVPMLVTHSLPQEELVTTLVAPPPPPPPPPAPATPRAAQPKAVERVSELRQPLKIPEKIELAKETPPPSDPTSVAGVVGGVPSGTPGGQIGGVIGGIISSAAEPVPVASPTITTPQRVRVSQGVVQGLVLQRVAPEYPPVAKIARIQGQVVLHAVIGKDGTVQNLQAVSGNPLLTPAALNAVKQWRFKPYLLNGEPTDVEALITVNFSLNQG
ncbi:MAG: TonB family protein [Terriglobales bacterium]|jgi:protein TonB